MDLLKQRIQTDGLILNNSLLKVDSFLNQQIDPELMMKIGEEFVRRFKDEKITKILTIESSGIAVSVMTGLILKVPVIFARKRKPKVTGDDVYTAKVYSYTKGESNTIMISKQFLQLKGSNCHDIFRAGGNCVRLHPRGRGNHGFVLRRERQCGQAEQREEHPD